MKYFIIILLVFSISSFAGGKKIELYKTSSLYTSKKKVSRTQWRRLPCKHCHGKGHKVIIIRRGNTSIRLLKQCLWCNGTGTRGLSKK